VMVSESFMTLCLTIFQARQKMEYLAFVRIFESSAVTLAGFYVLFNLPSVFNLSLGYLLGSVLAAFLLFFYLFRGRYAVFSAPRASVWREYLKLSWPLALNSLFATVCTSTDSVMMGHLGQITETGWYNAAQRVIGVSLIPISLSSIAFLPALSGSFKESKEKFRKVWDFYFNSVIFFAMPVLFGGIALAPRIISFAYGQGYSQSVLAFQILLLMVFINMISTPFSQALIVFNQQKKIFWVTLLGAILNVVLNSLFIPKYSLYGAAGATVAAFLTIFIFSFLLVRRTGFLDVIKAKFLINFLAAIFSSIIMYLLIREPAVYGLSIFLSIPIGSVVYAVVFSACLSVVKLLERKPV
jgi:O-antigen/teichoic acid export membrane protein